MLTECWGVEGGRGTKKREAEEPKGKKKGESGKYSPELSRLDFH